MHLLPSVSASRSTLASVVTCAAFLSASAAGCGSSGTPAANRNLEGVNQRTESLVESAEALTASLVQAVGIATHGFTKPLPQGAPLATDTPLSTEDRVRFDDAILASMAPAAATLLGALELVEAATQEGHSLIQASASGSVTSGIRDAGCVSPDRCHRRSGLVIESLIVMGGLGLVAWMGFGGAKDSFDARNEPTAKAIASATGRELEAMNEALGLPKDTPNTEALTTFQALPFNDRQAAHRRIEEINADPDIGSLSAVQDIHASVAKSAVIAAETGVKVYAKVPGMVGGGSTLGLLSKAKGWGEAGEVLDLTLDVADQALSASKTGRPIADKGTLVVATRPNEVMATNPPTHSMTSADARAILSETAAGRNLGTKTPEEVASAGSVVAKDLAVRSGMADKVRADGSVVATVPSQVYMTRLATPKWGDKVGIPAMGRVDVLFVAEGKVPQVVTDIETADGGRVGLADQDLASYDPDAVTPPATDVLGDDAHVAEVASGDAVGEDPGTIDAPSAEEIWLMCKNSEFGDGTGAMTYACTRYSGTEDPFSEVFQAKAEAQCKSGNYEGLSSWFFVEANPEAACVNACNTAAAQLPINHCDTPFASGQESPCQGVPAGSDTCWQNACYNCCGTCENGYVKLFDCSKGCAVGGNLCECMD